MTGPTAILVCAPRSEAREGGLEVTLRYAYDGSKPPPPKVRIRMAAALLGEDLARLRKGRPAGLSFAEEAIRRVRTGRMQA